MSRQIALIIGAGPAGLTAAHELIQRSDIIPLVIEASGHAGGIARTINYKGNRIDIGGHRFFSKSDRVMDWWTRILPIQGQGTLASAGLEIGYQNQRRRIALSADGPDPEQCDEVMLVRPRVSRILYRGHFFDYPIKPTLSTLSKLGLIKTLKIAQSYGWARLFPQRPENTLQDFLTNRFGHELYATFFRDYTEKVWGVPCDQIPAEWGAQRIKGLSITALARHALRSLSPRTGKLRGDLAQKHIETSLIEQFLYPKLGPGQLWEKVARLVEARGGQVLYHTRVLGLKHHSQKVQSVEVQRADGSRQTIAADLVLSTMPLRDLIAGLTPEAPATIREVALGLPYRDFMTVGLLLKRLRLGDNCTGSALHAHVPDNWIYVQEPGVKVGRIQLFNNWSPYLVADPEHIWLGLEYFVNEGDALWNMPDEAMANFVIDELVSIGVVARPDVLDQVVIRMPKTYPAYFGTYGRFAELRDYLMQFSNLYPLGRNGMHRYNNQDHSMLTAMTAVDGILSGSEVREALWHINTEQAYHETHDQNE